MSYSREQLLYVAKKANKLGGKGLQVIEVIPPQNATSGYLDFTFVTISPSQNATDRDWRD